MSNMKNQARSYFLGRPYFQGNRVMAIRMSANMTISLCQHKIDFFAFSHYLLKQCLFYLFPPLKIVECRRSQDQSSVSLDLEKFIETQESFSQWQLYCA